MAKNNYWITPHDDDWQAKREGAQRAARTFDTQKEAEDYARNIMQNGEGGELITQNKEGQIRSKDTINSNDPNPPKDREH